MLGTQRKKRAESSMALRTAESAPESKNERQETFPLLHLPLYWASPSITATRTSGFRSEVKAFRFARIADALSQHIKNGWPRRPHP
jgi:sirohydrochlorin ferrochelatase